MSVNGVGLNDVRKKILEEIKVGAESAHKVYAQVQPHVNFAEIGNRLSTGNVRPQSSPAASSL